MTTSFKTHTGLFNIPLAPSRQHQVAEGHLAECVEPRFLANEIGGLLAGLSMAARA